MDEYLTSSLPWQLKLAIMYAPGVPVALLILAIPKSWLARIGQLPCLSPNWITFWRLPIFWIGGYLFFYYSPFWGLMLFTVSATLDVTDGKMATAFKEHNVPRSAQAVRIGELSDPVVDKLCNAPLVAVFSVLGVIHPMIAVFIIMFGILGTITRPPFNLLQRFSRQAKASPIGKKKTLIENLGFLVCIPYYFGWVTEYQLSNVAFGIAMLLGALSVLSRMHIHASIDKAIDSMATLYQHKEI